MADTSDEKKSIVYFSTWSASSGLAAGSVRPSLDALAELSDLVRVSYVSIEGGDNDSPSWIPRPFRHRILHKLDGSSIYMRGRSLLRSILELRAIIKDERATILLCRGAPAGGICALASVGLSCALFVESYEPHSDYMVSAGLWKKWGVLHLISKYMEWLTLKRSSWIGVVAKRYGDELILKLGSGKKLDVIPCAADPDLFSFQSEHRNIIRSSLNISNRAVVVYVGKFGGLYMKEEAFRIISEVIKLRPNAFFLIISQDDLSEILTLAGSVNLSSSDYHVTKADHKDVGKYLSAADLGVGFHRSSERSFAFSPIKYAEYWSCGLPVVIPAGVGDEEREVNALGIGVAIDFSSSSAPEYFANFIDNISSTGEYRQKIVDGGREIRSYSLLKRRLQNAILESI